MAKKESFYTTRDLRRYLRKALNQVTKKDPVIITHHGKPVAMVVPYEEKKGE